MQKLFILSIALIALVLSQTTTQDWHVTFLDQINYYDASGQRCPNGHIDFENPCCADVKGLVQSTLGADRTPVLGNPQGYISSADSFKSWFHDDSTRNKRYERYLTFSKDSSKTPPVFSYTNTNFFPLDNETDLSHCGFGHNFAFTMQLHTNFTYTGGEVFNFQGDDDVWVFINNKLVVDLGGVHGPSSQQINLDNYGLTKQSTYNFDLFFAERHCCGSNIIISTTIALVPPPPPCITDTDGDGVPDCRDNCPTIKNPDQSDCDFDGIGDLCDDKRLEYTFPYVANFEYNVNHAADTSKTGSIGALAFNAVKSTANITSTFTDPIPNGTIPNFELIVRSTFQNSGTKNCPIWISFSSAVGVSDIRYALIVANTTETFERTWDNIDLWYSFKNTPDTSVGSTTGNGQVTLIIGSSDASCDNFISVGDVTGFLSYDKRAVLNSSEYYSQCKSNSTTCIYGTYRMNGYCACWSGAWGLACTMGGALPGTHVDPDIVSVITDAWNPATSDKIDTNYWYLDDGHTDSDNLKFQNNMAGRNFYRNFTGHPTCATWPGQVFDLQTTSPVSLDSAFFENQKLTMYVSQQLVDGRADGALFINYDDKAMWTNTTTRACVYPISPYITKEVHQCTDVWKVAIPWSIAKSCRWNITQEDAYLVYRGRVIIHNQEYTSIDVWRIVRSVLRVKLRFQRYLKVETPTIGITNDKVQKAAITKQIVALDLGSPALVEIGTLLNWPFKLYNFTMPIFPINVVETIVYDHDDCSGAYGQDCRQYWRTTLGLKKDACKLDGSYSLHYVLDCNEFNQANCSLNKNNASDVSSDVAFTLQSENFCAEVTVDVGITGNINSYADQSFGVVKTSYIVGRRVYYLIKVNSDLNVPNTPDGYDPTLSTTVVTFANISLVSVDVKYANGTLLRIWDNYAATVWANTADQIDYGTLCTTHTDKTTAQAGVNTPLLKNSIGFSFVFTRVFAQVPKNGKLTFTIVATVQANYNNLQKKRFTLQSSGSDKNTFSMDSEAADDTVTNTGIAPTGATGSNNVSKLIAGFLLFVFAILI